MFELKSFTEPDQKMEFPNGEAGVVIVGDRKLLRVRFDPGFRWTEDMAPMVGTEKCQTHHVLHVLAGRMGLRLADGTERETTAGDVVAIPPGHDSWTIGDEAVLFLDIDPTTVESEIAGE